VLLHEFSSLFLQLAVVPAENKIDLGCILAHVSNCFTVTRLEANSNVETVPAAILQATVERLLINVQWRSFIRCVSNKPEKKLDVMEDSPQLFSKIILMLWSTLTLDIVLGKPV
jgi:hypothetical protein